jgi:hypothetical protein
MRNERWTQWSVAWAATAAFGLAGCASEVGQGDPLPQASTTESVASAVSAESRGAKESDERCSPLACCFPTQGGGWQDDKLENRLKQLGCSTPAPYEQTKKAFWSWTECPFDLDLLATVFEFSASPYRAHFVENPCLPMHAGKAQVVFDPLCVTCGTQINGPPVSLE